jgi:hypothetical protein
MPIRWGIYKIAAKAVRLGNVEAPDEATAIEKVAAEFEVPKNRVMAIRRRRAARAKSPAPTSSATGRTRWRFRPTRVRGLKNRRYFELPPPCRRRRGDGVPETISRGRR